MLETGKRLGPYEVVAPIGAGGMGEVYKGRDTRLDRGVAIKVLPPHLSSNPDFKLRFDREARVISGLNHPNICTLYDVGSEAGVDYIVMELLDGQSLAERLDKGPLPLDQVLRYGIQIADALDRAHRSGIVHRDLKPGNIMITKSGAKLLDFGLAKPSNIVTVSVPGVTQESRTAMRPLTAEGAIIGTFQYMAPEQVEGLDADHRTDIFAFGAILYEMLTGKRAFDGKTKASLIASILDREPPPVASVQPLTPPSLERVIKICLAKDPDERWQNAHDLKRELEWIAEPGTATVTGSRRHRREWLLGGLAIAGALAAITLAWLHFGNPPSRPSPVISSLVLPEGMALSTVAGPMVFSPDGSRLAFVARDATSSAAGSSTVAPRIWVRQLSTGVVAPINGSEWASSLFWSPDGRALGFYADGKLKRIDAAGGVAEPIADASFPAGAAWLADGTIVASVGPRQPMLRIWPQERRAEPAIVHGSQYHGWPLPLPGGKKILYLDDGGGDESMLGLYSATLGSKEPGRLLLRGASTAQLVDGGYLLYVQGGDIRAVAFDAANLKMTGEPIRIAQGVLFDGHLGNALFSASRQGTIVFQPGASANVSQLSVVDRTGKVLKTLGKPAANYSPRISHDGKRVALDQSDPITDNGDIWIGDVVRGVWSRLTYTTINESAPVWTPDDRTVYYFRNRPDKATVWFKSAGGTGTETEMIKDLRSTRTLEWSRDGRYLALEVQEPDKRDSRDLWIFDKTTGKASPFMASPFDETCGTFSPDGRWLAYASTESGKNEVYLHSFPDGQERRVISAAGGSMPAWSPDGREVFFITPDRVMTAVAIRTTPSIDIGEPRALFATHLRFGTTIRQYDLMPDGNFLLNEMTGEETTRPMTLIQNWMPAER